MKKIFGFSMMCLMALTMLAFVSCDKDEKKESDKDKMARIQKECVGVWEGKIGEEFVSVAFGPNNELGNSKGLSTRITEWNTYQGKVFFIFDDYDGYSTSLVIDVDGDNMTLQGNSDFIKTNFPEKLTRAQGAK